MTADNGFIEQQIIEAVKGLLTGSVNDLIKNSQYTIPFIEFGDYSGDSSIVPVIGIETCERTEKERIIRVDAYSVKVSITFPETPDGELYCYAYSGAVSRALYDDPSLRGITNRTINTTKMYFPPKKPHCGEDWKLVITMRITVEGMGNAG